MRVAILGATSQIAKDLIFSMAQHNNQQVTLFARRVDYVKSMLMEFNLTGKFKVAHLSSFSNLDKFDVLINFVGAGDPSQILKLGSNIFDVTLEYDSIVIDYLKKNPSSIYIFLSSGAVYGSCFEKPVNENSKAVVDINKLSSQDWYALAKLHAEARHRALSDFIIIDIRIFNYFSHTQDINSRYFISDAVRSLLKKSILETSPDESFRDYLSPQDFFQLIEKLIQAKENTVVDAYSLSPISKFDLLDSLRERYGLKYEIKKNFQGINPTGLKINYYSINRSAKSYGYSPSLTSAQGIHKEIDLILAKN
jgi:nucleoside-diphosphate-sugar epimerase